ncbi:PspA/IM30 family protein [Ectobacillus funiculus]
MGIFFKRMKQIVLADIHDVLDKAEDPISMVGQYLREMEEQLARAQKAFSDQLFLEKKKYEMLVEETQAIIEKRVRQANLAVDRNQDEIAKLALQEKIVQEQKLASYKQQQETIQAQTANLSEKKVKELKDKYEELKLKQQELIARANTAKAVKAIQTTIHSFSTDNAMRGFARMEDRILALEAEAKASQAFAAHRQPSVNTLFFSLR